MEDSVQNIIMTVGLFPLSMLGTWVYSRLFGPFEKEFYWMIVFGAYAVMLFVCWGVETGFLYQLIH